MTKVDPWAELFLEPAASIEVAAEALGKAYRELIAGRDYQAKDVYRLGGAASASDFDNIASPQRVRDEVIAVLVANGLRELLLAASGDLQPAREPLTTTWSRRLAHDRFTKPRASQSKPPLPTEPLPRGHRRGRTEVIGS